eukprot:13484616-Alexandrium_andersonii.AAC.1
MTRAEWREHVEAAVGPVFVRHQAKLEALLSRGDMSEYWAHWTRLVERAFLDAYERAGAPPPEGAKGHGSPAF